jgi:hypothetical protein
MEGARQTIAVIMTFRKSSKNSLALTDQVGKKNPIIRLFLVGRDSSVGITTHYGRCGPRIESRWERDFLHPPRPAMGPTQPPIQWVSGRSLG